MKQLEKDKYQMISLRCGICKKKKLLDTESRLVVSRGRVGEMGGDGQKVSGYEIISHGGAMYSIVQ